MSQLKWSWFKHPRPIDHVTTYDDASRGVWGSLLLIFKLRAPLLPTLGAIITILAIAVDPFVQQIVRIHTCSQARTMGTASIDRTNQYSITGSRVGSSRESLDVPMQATIGKGTAAAPLSITPACSTGNCTFPNFGTVGVCSECAEATQTRYFVCSDDQTINDTCIGLACMRSRCRVESTSWGTPWGTSDVMRPNVTAPFKEFKVIDIFSEQYSLGPSFNLSTTFIYAWTNGSYDKLFHGEYQDLNPLTVQCSLYACVRTYSLEVVNGRASEKELSRIRMSAAEGPFDPHTAAPMPCIINGSFYEATAFVNRTDPSQRPVTGLLPNNQTAYLPFKYWYAFNNSLGLKQNIPYPWQGRAITASRSTTGRQAGLGHSTRKVSFQ